MRLRPIATACILAGISLLLYAFRLSAPPLTPAESVFNTQAQTISASNTPLFFHVRDEQWLQPAAVYANAAMRAIGGEELSGRIASALAASIGIALVFLIAHEITALVWAGLLAAFVAMLTPAYWSFAQLGTDAMIPLPLILLWLLSVLRFLRNDSLRALSIAALSLGAAIFTHPAAPLTAMFLWILTLVAARRRVIKRLIVATAVFGAAWLPAVAWFAGHMQAYPDTFGRWFVFAAHIRNPIDGMRAFVNPGTLGNRASLYWGFWDPSWLFFSTRDASAPLLMVAAPFIALGVARAVKHVPRDAASLLLGTALLAPLAGATFGVPHYLADATVVMPILAVLSALGVVQLVRLATRRPLEDGVAVTAVDGWNDDDALPRA